MALEKLEKGYCSEKIPLVGYAILTVTFNGLLLAALKQGRKRGQDSNINSPLDLLLMGIATHKLSRILTKDAVTSFIRAPFTRYQESLGYGEVSEKNRRSGKLEVVGELLSCNYCMSAWVGLGFFWGFSRFPKDAKALASFFSAIALSDFMHVAYEEKRTRANVLTLKEESMDRKKLPPKTAE